MSKLNIKQKERDLMLGDIGEDKILSYLQNNVDKNIKKYTDKYNIKDYYLLDENGKLIKEWELKTRRIRHNQYPTLVFGYNKYEDSLNKISKGIAQTYLFNCSNGIYKWDMIDVEKQKNEFYKGDICNKRRNDKPHPAIHIYTEHLIKV